MNVILWINHSQNTEAPSHKQPLEEIFSHTPSKNPKISHFIGDDIDIVKGKIIESFYPDFVSVANQIFNSQMNFSIEFRPKC